MSSAYLRDLVTRERMTAAHYLANSWVLGHIPETKDPGSYVMDFGCNRSILPMIMADRGHKVFALDRTAYVHELQKNLREQHQCKNNWTTMYWDSEESGRHVPVSHSTLNIVTAVWAIQHNEFKTQKAIIKELVDSLKPEGVLLVVSSYCPGGMFHDKNRQDPQWRVGPDELTQLIAESSCELEESKYFWYEHNTVDGEWCDPQHAVAVAYKLRKSC